MKVIVLKLGSSVLASDDSFPAAAREIARWLSRGYRALAVVSAVGRSTDQLLSRSRRLSGDPHPEALATLLATGEKASAALLTLALHEAGVPAALLDPERAGLRTEGPCLDAEPIALDAGAVRRALLRAPAAVLPGFYGRDAGTGGLTLLGRGGSDLTALFAAQRLGARCRLLKDVDGVYEGDPNGAAGPRGRYETLAWRDALGLGARVVQAKALRFAERHALPFEVSAPGSPGGTLVGPGPTIVSPAWEVAV